MVRIQYPEVVGTLEVVTVGGVLAPNQVIALDYSANARCYLERLS
jgi:hypothetical protein